MRYPHEFTLRRNRDSGAETELSKLLKGFGDLVFYGFADDSGSRLKSAFLGDLAAFRRWYMPHYGDFRDNGDGTGFVAYDKRFIPGFVLHEYTKPTHLDKRATKMPYIEDYESYEKENKKRRYLIKVKAKRMQQTYRKMRLRITRNKKHPQPLEPQQNGSNV